MDPSKKHDSRVCPLFSAWVDETSHRGDFVSVFGPSRCGAEQGSKHIDDEPSTSYPIHSDIERPALVQRDVTSSAEQPDTRLAYGMIFQMVGGSTNPPERLNRRLLSADSDYSIVTMPSSVMGNLERDCTITVGPASTAKNSNASFMQPPLAHSSPSIIEAPSVLRDCSEQTYRASKRQPQRHSKLPSHFSTAPPLLEHETAGGSWGADEIGQGNTLLRYASEGLVDTRISEYSSLPAFTDRLSHTMVLSTGDEVDATCHSSCPLGNTQSLEDLFTHPSAISQEEAHQFIPESRGNTMISTTRGQHNIEPVSRNANNSRFRRMVCNVREKIAKLAQRTTSPRKARSFSDLQRQLEDDLLGKHMARHQPFVFLQ